MASLYHSICITAATKNLLNLKNILEKGWEAAQASKMSETDFLAQSLAEDMFPLLKQIQIATDIAKAGPARFAGKEIMSLPDDEATVSQLINRIDAVLAHLETYEESDFEGAAEQKIELKYMPEKFQWGSDFLVDFYVPNFFFHYTMVYALIRAQGVELGKMDFLGSLKLHDC